MGNLPLAYTVIDSYALLSKSLLRIHLLHKYASKEDLKIQPCRESRSAIVVLRTVTGHILRLAGLDILPIMATARFANIPRRHCNPHASGFYVCGSARGKVGSERLAIGMCLALGICEMPRGIEAYCIFLAVRRCIHQLKWFIEITMTPRFRAKNIFMFRTRIFGPRKDCYWACISAIVQGKLHG